MYKLLHKLTKKEFDRLMKRGMLWVLYPEAPKCYADLHLNKYSINEIKSKNYLKR